MASHLQAPLEQEINEPFLRKLIRGQNIAIAILFVMVATGGVFDRQLFSLLPLAGVALIVGIAASITLRREYVSASSYVFFLGTSVAISINVYVRGYQDASTLYFLWPILGAMSIMRTKGGFIVLASSVGAYLLLSITQYFGVLHPPLPFDPQKEAFLTMGSFVIMFSLLAYLAWLSNQNATQALKQAREASSELKILNETLETRITDRTTELERRSVELSQASDVNSRRSAQFQAIAEVSRVITSIRELETLLPTIVNLVSESFGFYHVGIFLNDEVNDYSILIAANSEGGKRMIQRRHRLKIGEEGIVGSVIGIGSPRIALDTSADSAFYKNPDLPETRSEMALPLTVGERTIGALDVQSKQPNAFTEDDAKILAILADQVSAAIENTRLYETTRQSLAEAETIQRQYLQGEWKRSVGEQKLAGFRYSITGSTALEKPVDSPETQKAILSGEIYINKSKETALLAVPIKLRGETIGALNVSAPADYQWNDDQVDLVKSITDRLALSVENARLFDETTRRADRERTVSDITTKIRSITIPQYMLDVTMDELKRVLGAQDVQIRPYSPDLESQNQPGDAVEKKTKPVKKAHK